MNQNIRYATYVFAIALLFFSTKSMSYDAIFNITGRVSANTCSVQSAKTFNVNLGDNIIGWSGFGSGINPKSKKVDWRIDFNCDKDATIYFNFRGNNSSRDRELLMLSPLHGSAKGVGIKTELDFGTSSVTIGFYSSILASYSGVEGKRTLILRSYYVQTDSVVTPGIANASMDIDVTYQ